MSCFISRSSCLKTIFLLVFLATDVLATPAFADKVVRQALSSASPLASLPASSPASPLASLPASSPAATVVSSSAATPASSLGSSTSEPVSTASASAASFPVKVYAALGESFASGPSAGDPFENPNPCRRFTQAFGPQVNSASQLEGSNRKFDFIACSGSKAKNIYQDSTGNTGGKPSTSQAGQLSGEDPDLVTLSIGGNDVGFVNLLDHCVYRFYDPFANGCGFFNPDCTNDCNDAVAATQANIDGDALSSGLDSAINAIFQNAPGTHLYLTLYPRFFDATTTQCNNVQFNLGCAGYCGVSQACRCILPLTQARRGQLNTLTDNLNNQIKAAVGRAQPGSGGSINWIDTNPGFQGHRFCEEGTNEPSYRNPNIYFYPYEFYTGGTLSYVQSFDNTTNCNDILNNGGDQGDFFACELAEGIANGTNGTAGTTPAFLLSNATNAPAAQGDGVSTDSSNGLPDWAARIFHPTILGMTAYKDAIIAQYLGDAAASISSSASPSTVATTGSSSLNAATSVPTSNAATANPSAPATV